MNEYLQTGKRDYLINSNEHLDFKLCGLWFLTQIADHWPFSYHTALSIYKFV